jgi:prophage maintenance system killer protein
LAGNDRSAAFVCAVVFIEANGYSLTLPNSEAIAERISDFADHRLGENALGEWLRYRIDLPAPRKDRAWQGFH